LISIGSANNVDPDSIRARIIYIDISTIPPSGGIDYSNAQVWADGQRNDALGIDEYGRIWGVGNNIDDLYSFDLGGDIHTNNPGEEVNIFMNPGRFYGYPYCWSEGILNSPLKKGPTAQWVYPEFNATYNDTWCDDDNNVIKPVWVLPAHTAPLDILFDYNNNFPYEYYGNAYIALHGSWDRNPPNGYRIERLVLSNTTLLPIYTEPFFSYIGPGTTDGTKWTHRPVNLAWAKCPLGQCLFVSSDSDGFIIGIGVKNDSVTSFSLVEPSSHTSHTSHASTYFTQVTIILSLFIVFLVKILI